MNLKYIGKKLAIICFVGAMSMTSLTGCGKNTKVVFTSGLSGNQLFKIGTSKCTMPEAMIYLTTFYNQYGDIYGPEMWDYDFGGVSLEEHVKDVVLSKLAQIKIMNLMAEERGIELSKEEKDLISEAAEKYFDVLEDTLKEKENITKDIVEQVYLEYALANKVYLTITEAADMEISDDEARTVTVQAIYFQNWKMKNNEKTALSDSELQKVKSTAQNVLQKIAEGEAFDTLAAQYSDEKQIVMHYGRGMTEKAFEEVLFSLDEGEVSDLVETADGFYIVKCISTMDYDATQENKLILAEQRKKEAFSKAYSEVAENTHSQFRDKQWNALNLNEEIHVTDANFFDIYHEFMN